MNKSTVTIGIAAYNAEKNIANMLVSLLKQKELDFNLKKIIVHSDASNDKTISEVKKIKNKKIVIIDNKKQKGFAGSFKTILELINDDFAIMLNDDILIKDSLFVNKLISMFLKETDVGLVCGHPMPLKPTNFIERAITSSWRAYDKMRLSIKNGNNEYACDGKILALSKQFIQKYDFPRNLSDMGNVDCYTYFSCIKKGFKFRFARNAFVYYRAPSTFGDYVKWYTRNNSDTHNMRKKFGSIVDQEYKKPPFLFWRCMFTEFVKNPIGSSFIFIMSFYITYKSKAYSKNFNPIWEVVTTSKNL